MTRAFALTLLISLSLSGCSSGKTDGMKPSSDSKSGGSNSDSEKSTENDKSQQKSTGEKSITVPPAQQQLAGISVVVVEPRSVPRSLSVPGQIVMNEQRTVHISPYADGRVMDILKNQGDHVQRGQVLAHLHSHSIHETVGALAQDFANVSRLQASVMYAQQKRDRYEHLYSIQAASLEQQQGSQQELLQAQTDLANAQAAVRMEREHLGDLLSVTPASITPANLYQHELVPVITPISGTVITRSITPGMVLEPGNEAYTVSDLDEVWMMAQINEADLSQLRVGDHATVHSDAWPNQTFPGTVALIGSTLDQATRTIQVRITLPNPAGRLKPQMFVTAVINEGRTEGGMRQAIFVPEDSLQEVNGVQVVFITTDGTHFSPRSVKTMKPVNGQVEVSEGLRPGDRVAVKGTFMLKSDLLKGTIDEQ
jgi:cobalt-zinc-cadmium efflux system membrane fusion protein